MKLLTCETCSETYDDKGSPHECLGSWQERADRAEARVAELEAAGRRLVLACREAVTACLRSREIEYDDAREAMAKLINRTK